MGVLVGQTVPLSFLLMPDLPESVLLGKRISAQKCHQNRPSPEELSINQNPV